MKREKLRAFKRFTTWFNGTLPEDVERFLKEISEWDDIFCGRIDDTGFNYTELLNECNPFKCNRDWLLNDVSSFEGYKQRIRTFVGIWMERSIYTKFADGKYSINLYEEKDQYPMVRAVFTLEYDYSKYELFWTQHNLSKKQYISHTKENEEPKRDEEKEMNDTSEVELYAYRADDLINNTNWIPYKATFCVESPFEDDVVDSIKIIKHINLSCDVKGNTLQDDNNIRKFLKNISEFDSRFCGKDLIQPKLWDNVPDIYDNNRDYLIDSAFATTSYYLCIKKFINNWLQRSDYILCGGNYALEINELEDTNCIEVNLIIVYPVKAYEKFSKM